MHLVDWLLAHQICNQWICMHCVEQRRAVGHDGDDERNGMSQAGLFHPQRQGAGERQTLCNTMARQTESECKRVNICNSSMWPVAFLKSHPYGRSSRTPTRSFPIMNLKKKKSMETPNPRGHKQLGFVWSDVSEGEVGRRGQERRRKEGDRLNPARIWTGRLFLPIQMRRGAGGYFWAYSKLEAK